MSEILNNIINFIGNNRLKNRFKSKEYKSKLQDKVKVKSKPSYQNVTKDLKNVTKDLIRSKPKTPKEIQPKFSDSTLETLQTIEDILLDSILIKSKVSFTSEDYSAILKQEIKSANIYPILKNTGLIKTILIKNNDLAIKQYNNHLNTLLTVLESPEWLLLIEDDYFVDSCLKLITEPLNSLKDGITFSDDGLELYHNKLISLKNEKNKLLQEAEQVLENSQSFSKNGSYQRMIKEEQLLKLERSNVNTTFSLLSDFEDTMLEDYITKLEIHVNDVFESALVSFKDYTRLESSLKFRNPFTFLLNDFSITVDKFKPILNIGGSELHSTSKLYDRLTEQVYKLESIIHLFNFADYSKGSTNIIKLQHFRFFLYKATRILNELKSMSMPENEMLEIFNDNFLKIVDNSIVVIQDLSWSESDWSILDSYENWIFNLDSVGKLNFNKDNIGYELLLDGSKPSKMLYETLSDFELYHMLDYSIDTILDSYLGYIETSLNRGNLKITQNLLDWYNENLSHLAHLNKGQGFLVNELLKTNKFYGSKILIKDLKKYSFESFLNIFSLCNNLIQEDFRDLPKMYENILKVISIYTDIYRDIQKTNTLEINFDNDIKAGKLKLEEGSKQ